MAHLVPEREILWMSEFIKIYGAQAFRSAVFHGAFGSFASQYLHPEEELKKTADFDLIQKAFINGYT